MNATVRICSMHEGNSLNVIKMRNSVSSVCMFMGEGAGGGDREGDRT